MNWLLVMVLAVIVGFTIWGYRKGAILMFLSFGTIVLSVIITGTIGPVVSDSLCKSQVVLDYVSDAVNDGLGIESRMEKMTDEMVGKITNTSGKKKLNQKQQKQAIDKLALPETIRETLTEGIANKVSDFGQVTAKKFAGYLCDEIAKIIIKGITYIVVFLVVRILLKIVVSIFKVIDKLPVVEETSEMLGGAIGAVTGFIIVWVGFLFLLAFSGTTLGIRCYECINDSAILTFLYNNNLLLKWILSSFGK